MSGKTPGTKGYDKQRTRLRDEIENSGGKDRGADSDARANEILQDDEGKEPRLQSDRGLGPKGQRGNTD